MGHPFNPHQGSIPHLRAPPPQFHIHSAAEVSSIPAMVSFSTWIGTKEGVEKKAVTRPALTGHQAFVKTTHSGLCGSDVHFKHAGIGLGHEGAGVVAEIGPEVTNLKVGDRVAWGWVR